jgi:hypothetical protein
MKAAPLLAKVAALDEIIENPRLTGLGRDVSTICHADTAALPGAELTPVLPLLARLTYLGCMAYAFPAKPDTS